MKIKNKLINFIADFGKRSIYVFQIFIILLFIFYKLNNIGDKMLSFVFDGFFKEFLILNSSNLISLSAIFLGIYFTLFTLISTLDINSWITKLPNKRFKEIINLIKNGFTMTFIYVLYLLFVNSISEKITENKGLFYDIIFLINFLLCMYILFIALVVATIIYTAYQKDISEFNENKEQKINDEKDIKLFISETRNFIDRTQNSLTKINKKIEDINKKS